MDYDYSAGFEDRAGDSATTEAVEADRAPKRAVKTVDRGRRRSMTEKKDRRYKAIIDGPGRSYWRCGAYVKTCNGRRGQSAYVIHPSDSRMRCYLKQLSNKRIRKKRDVPNFAGYRRMLDFWWMLD
jgi:hypothetical protein